MDDLAIECLCSAFDRSVTISPGDFGGYDEIRISKNDSPCDSSQEVCSVQGEMFPVLVKLEDISNKIRFLRKEHEHLCSEMKGITLDSLIGSEAFTALYDLCKKYAADSELLKMKYLEECSETKKLYNKVIEFRGNIRVFCRCRPMKQEEFTNGSTSVIEFDSFEDNELNIISSESSRKRFKFDHIFKPEDSQDAVFDQTLPMVTSVLDGYNVCIFAYGQTGTGKTYPMEGTPENRGVNYRTLESLFRISEERSKIVTYELFVSMLEVYNEKIRDLLVDSFNHTEKKLEIKQSAEGTQEVPGLVEARAYSTSDVWSLLQSGSQARSVGSTNANELSSRSHCLLRVTVVGKNRLNGQTTKSHLWLVDLAGSERVGRIEVEGERLKESQFINKSLSALGDVISALASKSSHVPYRNSKLTHLLQSSLGGDCKTLMFVQISPSLEDLGETLCSLNFASRVRGVENGPARRHLNQHSELLKYKQLAEKAKQEEKETRKLQENAQSLQLRLAAREQICKNLQDKLRDLENQLENERKARIQQENRALAAISTQSKSIQAPKISLEKKPPLAPLKARLPLRRITNFMPLPSPAAAMKSRMPFLASVSEEKENASSRPKLAIKARRGSIAVRPIAKTSQAIQPKRRASIATIQPGLSTPVYNLKPQRIVGTQSFVWDPKRVFKTSRLSSPKMMMTETPLGGGSSKFTGSPASKKDNAASWKPKHPTVVALQKKRLIWSPLKSKGLKNRASFIA